MRRIRRPYKKISKPFGNRYPPLCLNIAQKIFLRSFYSYLHLRKDHVKRKNETRWFSFRLHLTAQETYYTVYTRYKKYLFKYNQGCELRPNKFLVFIQCYIVRVRWSVTQMFNIILERCDISIWYGPV